MSAKSIAGACALVVLSAAVFAAASGAEPKNQWPFTRPLDSRTLALSLDAGVGDSLSAGEPKNESPFTARVSADPGLAIANREITRYYAAAGTSARAASGASGPGLEVALVFVFAAAGLGGLVLFARRGGFVKVS
jgi:hypothetical protein